MEAKFNQNLDNITMFAVCTYDATLRMDSSLNAWVEKESEPL